MSSFSSWRSFYKFSVSIKKEYRYIHSEESMHFLNCLINTSKDKEISLTEGTILYRSQKGYDEIEEYDHDGQTLIHVIEQPYKPSRMIPDSEKVGNGRANVKGIPCLYLSDNEKTAIAEIRPWLNEKVSVAVFKILRNLRIIDLSNIELETRIYLKEPTDPNVIENEVWASVNRAFSRPISQEDQDIDYIPTQIISELFKRNGFDGIKYKSLLSPGNNYAIYNLKDAIPINGVVCEIKSLNYLFEQYSNPVSYSIDGIDERTYNHITDFKSIDKNS
jgi:hypothetical protein